MGPYYAPQRKLHFLLITYYRQYFLENLFGKTIMTLIIGMLHREKNISYFSQSTLFNQKIFNHPIGIGSRERNMQKISIQTNITS
jgi:hypothetical protein